MHDNKKRISVRVRPFGSRGVDNNLAWPQDMAQTAGIEIVHGFVVDIASEGCCSPKDIISAVEESTPHISLRWEQMIGVDFCKGERALVQVKTGPAAVSNSENFIVNNFECADSQGAMYMSREVLYVYNDLSELCIHLHPVLASIIPNLKHIALTKAKKARLWHLSSVEFRCLISEIMTAYQESTGYSFPKTPMEQLMSIITRSMHSQYQSANQDELSAWKASFAIRTRPLQLLPPALGCGVALFGASAEQLMKRGSFSESMGFDYLEDGIAQTQPLENVSFSASALQSLEHINDFCVNHLNDHLRIGFILFADRLVVDSISPAIPTGELILDIFAKQLLRDPASLRVNDISQAHIRSILYSKFKTVESEKPICTGIPAAPGACFGVLATSFESAMSLCRAGLPVIFYAPTPTPEAMRALALSVGAVFQTGGATSHVAVIARGMGKPCIMGIAELESSQNDLKGVRFSQTTISEGEWFSVDGTNGSIFIGKKEVVRTPMTEDSPLYRVLEHCDKVSRMQVYVNADNVSEASLGFDYGAKGIGLCRIEHMLLHPDMVNNFTRTIVLGLASIDTSSEIHRAELRTLIWKDSAGAIKALEACHNNAMDTVSYQRYHKAMVGLQCSLKKQLYDLFSVAKDRPVTIRYLDPPLCEFITEKLIEELVHEESITPCQAENVKRILRNSGEMMGLRGVRLGLILPELTEMQTMAAYEVACEVSERIQLPLTVNFMAPFIVDPMEFQLLHLMVTTCLNKQNGRSSFSSTFNIGAMIETPRAAMLVGELAKTADFLSFGTNDLSQFMWAYSRDSSENDFLQHPPYSTMDNSPFKKFDIKGVGTIMAHAIKQAKLVKPLPIGVCGEHARDSKAIKYFNEIGVDYVSCVPYAVPEARLSTAHSAMASGKEGSK